MQKPLGTGTRHVVDTDCRNPHAPPSNLVKRAGNIEYRKQDAQVFTRSTTAQRL